jgi:hypothetical protein
MNPTRDPTKNPTKTIGPWDPTNIQNVSAEIDDRLEFKKFNIISEPNVLIWLR